MNDNLDAQLRWMEQVLAAVIRASGLTRQGVEKELGWSSGYLSKLLGGQVELRPRHILAVLAVAKMEPADFFSIVFPKRRRNPSGIDQAVRAHLRLEPLPESADDLDASVRRILSRLLGLPETEKPT